MSRLTIRYGFKLKSRGLIRLKLAVKLSKGDKLDRGQWWLQLLLACRHSNKQQFGILSTNFRKKTLKSVELRKKGERRVVSRLKMSS